MTPDRSVSTSDLADDRRFRRWGVGIVAAVFAGLGVWSATAPLSSAALAPGVITVENYRKTVQHLEGGIVKAIHVHDGDVVDRGQVLVTLDDTQARAQFEVQRGQFFMTAAREARLIAQRDGLPAVRYPKVLLASASDERARDAMRVQDETFQARRHAQLGETGLYERQIEQLQAKARGLRAQLESQDRLAGSFRSELDDVESLLKDGYAEKQKARELERSLAQAQGQRGQIAADIAAAELQVAETRQKIVQLNKELQRDVAKELTDVQSELFGLRDKLVSLQATLDRTVLRTPEPGTVLSLAVHTIGAVVPPGGRLMDIVPRKERLVVEAQVSPLDVDRVRVGQSAEIRFPSFRTRDTPKIEGRLVSLSADRITDEKEKAAYYLARVEVSPQGLKDLASLHLDLVPGMPAEVLIRTGSRTPLQYLLDPLRNAVARSFTEK